MPKLKMTDAAVQRVTAAPGERADFFDAHPRDRQRGLVLRVSGSKDKDGNPQVTRTWAVMCRVAGDKTIRRVTIGQYPEYSLADAREEAAEIVKKAKHGIDETEQRKAATEAATKAREAEEAKKKNTVTAVFEDWLKHPKKGKSRSPRYIQETRRSFRLHVAPEWGKRAIGTITRREILRLLDNIADRKGDKGGPVQANRTLALIRAVFNFAVGRDVIDASPAVLIDGPGAETKRERTLKAEELAILMPAMDALDYPAGSYLLMLLATGQRRSEVAAMHWADIDTKEKTWTLAVAATKAARAHVVPLSPLAIEILESVPRIAGGYVFAGTGRRSAKRDDNGNVMAGQPCPLSGFAKRKTQLDAKVKKAGANLAPWTLHDLRRTAATEMARLGISQFVIARVLNHADRSVTGIYNRYEYLAEKRHGLDTWARFLEGLNKPAEVPNLAEERARRAG